MKDREELKEFLKKLHVAKPDELKRMKKEARKYFKDIDTKELAFLEQELIQEGMEHKELKRLCDVHLQVLKQQLGLKAKKIKLPAAHPISICRDEHKVIKRNLNKLKNTFERIKNLDSFEGTKLQISRLKELAHFFLETDKHYKREEDALFPRLEAHGITEPPKIFKEDHIEFMAKKKEFYNIIMSENKDYKQFINRIGQIINFLTENLKDHIYKEDNILYPMALETLEKSEWKDVRKKFDAIGYCCFAPEDLSKHKKSTLLSRTILKGD